MLTEEAHHMFVGETGVGRVVQRACELMKEDPNEDVARPGRHRSADRSSATSTSGTPRASTCSAARSRPTPPTTSPPGSRAGPEEERYEDHVALEGNYEIELLEDGELVDARACRCATR